MKASDILSDPSVSSAQLLVVQHGSRASFRRRVIDAMRTLVPASGAFCFFGLHDERAFAEGARIVGNLSSRMPQIDHMRLSTAFAIDPQSVVASSRRAYLASELYSEEGHPQVPYFSVYSAPAEFKHALIVFLHEGGVLFGVAGLERRAAEGEFTGADIALLEKLAPFVIAGGRAHIAYDELTREASALRALGKIKGALYVVDRDNRRVVWAVDRQHGIDWQQDVEPFSDAIVNAAEQMIAANVRGDAIPTPMRFHRGTVFAVAKLDDDPVFRGGRCAVVRVESPADSPAAIGGLSKREREIARLLVAGYSGVNVAAISGLSENTVRTYVRRLYHKLDVANRADLVRKLMLPSPQAAPESVAHIAPPPDSSLADGDDTLD